MISQNQMKNRIYIKDLKEHAGAEVTIGAWVDVRRDQGKLIFLDFRDKTGRVQGVILPGADSAKAIGETLRPEWVVEVRGKVNNRPEKNIQAEKQNGDIELEVLEIIVLNEAETPQFELGKDTREVNEDTRLKYRYLDLRTDRLQKNLRHRHKMAKLIRDIFDEEGYIEVETPLLTKSTPEGARDFLVPSRLEKGVFYALPQSPQQYKQLLMAGGIENYFQIAKCMRDEDSRGDRQPEFTQMDVEASFVTEEDIMALNEKILIDIVTKMYPEKRIQEIPFPRIPYHEAMEKYGIDRPDIRENKEDPNLLAFCWVVDFPFFERDTKGGWTFTHNPFSAPKQEFMETLMNAKRSDDGLEKIIAAQYDIVLNGSEIGGGSIRNHQAEALFKVFEILGYEKEKVENDFYHMIKALKSGTPPHGGIAWGLDRLLMLLENEPNIREVMAFPKTGEGRDPMMQAPSGVSAEQLRELNLIIKQ